VNPGQGGDLGGLDRADTYWQKLAASVGADAPVETPPEYWPLPKSQAPPQYVLFH
jgi:hypothetical protein